jgi:SAM-dependent methyltransferase
MTAHAPEYVTDVPYLRMFVGDAAPSSLRLVAALNGFAPPRGDAFAFCELGSGLGDTTATLAAACPQARFFGVDFNAEHVASARRLAAEGGLDNVRFVEKDFEALLADDDLPPLDFIAAHGVLSWVGPVKRRAVLELARAKLKPGGLLYVGYNAFPGWAAVEPLRRLLVEGGAAAGDDSLERARQGLALAKGLREGGAAYFKDNPAAVEMLATMERLGLPYVVHEYLHAHWVPMYFAQVAAEMAANDLYFVGQLPLYLNYRDLAIPAPLAPLFQRVADRITFETLKDFARNEFFRRDVFVKGRVGRDLAAATAYLESIPFGAAIGASAVSRDVQLPHHTLHFAGDIFDALLPALGAGASSVEDLARDPTLAGYGTARLREALVRLALGGQVTPMTARTRAAPEPARSARLRVPSAFNRRVLREATSGDAPIVLASAVAGTGVSVPRLDAVTLRLLTEVPEGEWRAWFEALERDNPLRLKVGDRPVAGEEAFRVLVAHLESFRARRLPRFVELGIVEETPARAGA